MSYIYDGVVGEESYDKFMNLFHHLNRQHQQTQVLAGIRAREVQQSNINERQKSKVFSEILNADKQELTNVFFHEIIERITKVESLLVRKNRRGIPFGTRFTVTDGAPEIVIDFVKDEDHVNKPDAVIYNIPYQKVGKLTIINEGTGTLSIGVGVSEDGNREKTSFSILNGNSFSIESHRKEIHFVVIKASGANTGINIIAEI